MNPSPTVNNRITKNFGLVKSLPADLMALHDNDDNGFWCYATREIVDTAGDVIRVDGIDYTKYHRPNEGIYLKILAGHEFLLPDGTAPVLAIAKEIVKTSVPYEGRMVKALALYVEWLRDPTTGELLPLTAKYKQLKDAGGIDQVSIGFSADINNDRTFMESTGGYDYARCCLFETSLVAVPCNVGATFIKSVDADETPVVEVKVDFEKTIGDALAPVLKNFESIAANIKTVADKLDAFAARLDVMESALLVLSADEEVEEVKAVEPTPVDQSNDLKALSDRLDKFITYMSN